MNKAGMTGLILCLTAIIFGIATNGGIGTLANFVHIPSLIVTVGGASFALLASMESLEDFFDGWKSIYCAYQKPTAHPEEVSEQIIEMANLARREGLLSLDDYIKQITNEFMGKGVRLIVDGTDPELTRDILESELLHKEDRNRKRVRFWNDLGAYCPAWGMVGTLLGLINMMRSMGTDAGAIGAGMSLALITTLYGSVMANWICIPVGRKLENSSEQESLVMEVIIEGVLSIQAGENARIIKEKIKSILEEEEAA